MDYQIKAVRPGSVFIVGLPINMLVGLISALFSYIIMPALSANSSPYALMPASQRLVATLMFTIVYGLAASAILSGIALIYNLWSARFKGIVLHLEQNEPPVA